MRGEGSVMGDGGRVVGWCRCAGLIVCAGVARGQEPNVLIVVADDLGVDRVAAYAAHPDPGNTPVLDGLAANGLLFQSAYADPLCSPSRAGMLTGRYGYRTGVTNAINYEDDIRELDLDEITLAEALPDDYACLAIGKWHLSQDELSGPLHPLLQGFDHHAGSMTAIDPHGETYFDYDKWIDGAPTRGTQYATTDSVDDALAALADTPRPWFLWLAFNAPHAPFHKPPPELHSVALPEDVQSDVPGHVKAAIEALDTELGRLLAALEPSVLANTLIVFVGDNGTHGEATTPPSDPTHGKGSPWEGGVHVPLIVSGPGVPRGARCDALVNTTDLFATVLDVAGGDASSGVDSVSLVPYFADPGRPSLRDHVYSGLAGPLGYHPTYLDVSAVRDDRYKLVRLFDHVQGRDGLHLYDLRLDPDEQVDLLAARTLTEEQQAAFDALQALAAGHASPWSLLPGESAGSTGLPALRGDGALLGGELATLSLRRGLAHGSATLILGFTPLLAPFAGGLLVPNPAPGVLLALTLDEDGAAEVPLTWPPDVPAGVELYAQGWIADPGGTNGLASSNGLLAVTP